MLEDRYGNVVSTSSQAARDHYVNAVDRFLAADGGVAEAFQRSIDADDSFGLAHIGLARYHQMRGEREKISAPLAIARQVAGNGNAREAAQIEALGLLLDGKGAEAYQKIRAHLVDHPRDVMIAQTCMGVFGLIGFSGQPGRESEQLAFTTSLAPHYGDDWWFLSQHAFAQLEIGQTGPAEETIERSLRSNPRSANGAHIRSHLYYENGETTAGLDYLRGWRQDYPRDGLLHCHVSWHVALWALEQGDLETMWSVIDADIKPGSALGPPLNILTDTAAILFRAELAGVDVPSERWHVISDYAREYFPQPAIAFADVHAALAHAMAGNGDALAKIVSDATGPAGDVVSKLAEAFGAIAAQDWQDAKGHLTSAMADHARIGGSRAQRDLIEFAMAATLLRLGETGNARSLMAMHRPKAASGRVVQGLDS